MNYINDWLSFSCDKQESSCCELPFKAPQEEREDSQEAVSSLAAAKEVCRCCSGDSFIRIGWLLFFFNLQELNYNSTEGFFSVNNIFHIFPTGIGKSLITHCSEWQLSMG